VPMLAVRSPLAAVDLLARFLREVNACPPGTLSFATVGTGPQIMRRNASPIVGGMLTAPLLSMLVVPAASYLLLRRPLWVPSP